MTFEEFWKPLTAIYEAGEAKAIARLVMEVRFGLSMTDVVCGKTGDEKEMQVLQQRLLTGEPLQYVLGEAEFGERTFHVEPGVLIPRSETYELCEWIFSSGLSRTNTESTFFSSGLSRTNTEILDIGTGSGCIAITLAAEIPNVQVTAWDISDDALRIASENAKRANVHVSFEKVDVLNSQFSILNSQFDIIVSNPPYVCNKERAGMERNVLEHEPELALFVPDDDPLLFYRAIARYAARALKPSGQLFFEINPLYADEMQQMLSEEGFSHIEVRNDQFGKQRFTKSWL